MEQSLADALRRDALMENEREEAQELALSYAQDIVNSWPNMTLRTMSHMTSKINALREALELAKK